MAQQFPVQFTEEEWRNKLTSQQFKILRESGTERPFSGKYNNHTAPGTYTCAGCNAPLFEASAKFNHGCGWPSFDQPKDAQSLHATIDHSHNMVRTEISCSQCGGHLGHVFDDGPTSTGMRYCINSLSLGFEEDSNTPSTNP